MQHLTTELLRMQLGLNLQHVPYRGGAPAMADLLAGVLPSIFSTPSDALTYVQAKKLRALATTGAKRDATLPDLPTIAEAGVKGYESGVWFGLAAPAGTPADIIAKLSAAAIQGTKSPEFVNRMTELGYNILGTNAAEMASMNQAEIQRWGPIVKASGAKAD